MYELVNPSHPDKLADRIAGAIVDLAYATEINPKVAVEVLIGHGVCHIICESSVDFEIQDIKKIVHRIVGTDNIEVDYVCVPQDKHLAENQQDEIRCGDNGIFKGLPETKEEHTLHTRVRNLYKTCPYDGKFIIHENKITACQSNLKDKPSWANVFNPLGYWTGGINVDSGATNRKLGSDMGQAVTGGGIHGKDLSKADVSVNVACHYLANLFNCEVTAVCAIGDKNVKISGSNFSNDVPYSVIISLASNVIKQLGGFEKLAEWGLLC